MIKTLFTYGFGESVAKGINWLILATLPLLVTSTADYGIIGLLVAIEAVGSTALLVGLDRAVLRFYHQDASPGRFLSTLLILGTFPFVPFLIFAAALSLSVDEIAGIPVVPHLCLLVSALLFLNLHKIYLALLRVEEASRAYVVLRILFVSLKAFIVLGVALNTHQSIAYVYGILIASVVAFLVTVPGIMKRIQPAFDRSTAKQLWLFGWPFIFHVLSGNLLVFADRFMLEYYTDLSVVGTYTYAYTLGSAVAFIFAALSIYFEPQIYKKAGDAESAEKLLSTYSASCIMLGAVWSIAVLVIQPFLVSDILGESYRSILLITPIILAAHLLMPVYLQANYRLTLYEKTRVLATGTVVAAVLNIALNMMWIPSLGAQGAALATFASLLALSAIVFVASIRSTEVAWKDVKSLRILVLTAVGMIGLVSFGEQTAMYIILAVLAVLAGSFLFYTSTGFRALVLRSS